MDLIQRYVQAVKQFLPHGQRQDISQELSENLQSAMDDRAAELGRPLTEAEQAAMLKQFGHPVLVAGRYQTGQHSLAFGPQLIGPVLFPLYARSLGLAISLMVAGNVVAIGLTSASFEDSLVSILGYALVQFAIITGIFAAGQQHLNRHPNAWDPRDPLAPVTLPANPRWVPRFESLTQVVVISVALLWLRTLHGLTLPAETGLIGSPVWETAYWVLLGLTAATLGPPLVNLIQPRWVLLRTVARLVVDAVWLGLLFYLLSAGPWVTSGIAASVNPIIKLSLQWTILVSAIILLFDARPLLRRPRPQ